MDAVTVQHVTPTTSALLRWWFQSHGAGVGFQEGPRQILLDTVTAHEALDGASLQFARPAHRLSLTDSEQKLQVMLALLVWQLLNRLDARAAGVNDPHFTDQFVLVAPDSRARARLFDALCGPCVSGDHDGARDFGRADLVRLAHMLVPTERHAEVFGFVRAHAGGGTHHRHKTAIDSVIAITDDRLEALECLARLPDAMMFDDETRPPYRDHREDIATGTAWRRQLRRFASARNGHGAQVLFTHPSPGGGRHRTTVNGTATANVPGNALRR